MYLLENRDGEILRLNRSGVSNKFYLTAIEGIVFVCNNREMANYIAAGNGDGSFDRPNVLINTVKRIVPVNFNLDSEETRFKYYAQISLTQGTYVVDTYRVIADTDDALLIQNVHSKITERLTESKDIQKFADTKEDAIRKAINRVLEIRTDHLRKTQSMIEQLKKGLENDA